MVRPLISRLFGHTVTIEPYQGEGAHGAVFGPPTQVPCRINARRRYDRSAERHQVTAETVIYLPRATDCPKRSQITLPDGQVTTATVVAPRDGGRLPTPAHLEVTVR